MKEQTVSLKGTIANVQLSRAKKSMVPGELMFPDALRSPKHILVCLPPGLRELTLVKQFLPNIVKPQKTISHSGSAPVLN